MKDKQLVFAIIKAIVLSLIGMYLEAVHTKADRSQLIWFYSA